MSSVTYWLVLKSCSWENIEGVNLIGPPNGPEKFMPLFSSYDRALEWSGGRHDLILRVSEVPQEG